MAIGPQVKLGWFTASFEVGFDDDISFDLIKIKN
tara:strand:+ start:1098 stop:1199 length:102 start_codon:yes stop_codon:yes gene_type:complete